MRCRRGDYVVTGHQRAEPVLTAIVGDGCPYLRQPRVSCHEGAAPRAQLDPNERLAGFVHDRAADRGEPPHADDHIADAFVDVEREGL